MDVTQNSLRLTLSMESCTLLCRPIILLESNTGYPQIHQLLEKAGHRSKACAPSHPCSTIAATAVPPPHQSLRQCNLAFRNPPTVDLPVPQTLGTGHAVGMLCRWWAQWARLPRCRWIRRWRSAC